MTWWQLSEFAVWGLSVLSCLLSLLMLLHSAGQSSEKELALAFCTKKGKSAAANNECSHKSAARQNRGANAKREGGKREREREREREERREKREERREKREERREKREERREKREERREKREERREKREERREKREERREKREERREKREERRGRERALKKQLLGKWNFRRNLKYPKIHWHRKVAMRTCWASSARRSVRLASSCTAFSLSCKPCFNRENLLHCMPLAVGCQWDYNLTLK